jgi:sterol desaturase/sphingolipid hydroxylase (fatty acid hydroxylase superfamily)/uncharacterized membrane protein YhhN
MALSPSQVIVVATPVFLGLIALELAVGLVRRRNTYRFSDALSSISLGMISESTKVLTRLLRVGIYAAVYHQVSLVPLDAARAFWTSWYGWLLALVFYDFCYYWLHRAGHEVAVLWAAHVVHHQSQQYNLSTALRQTSSGALLGWVFYLPMALAGVPPLVFGIVALVDLLYQFWVHTEHVGKLGWFDRWFCSPSNHRVHHAVNDTYVDRNYGGVLVIWDRMFGSFAEEREPCIYGTRKPLNSWDPLWSNAEVYWALARDSWRTRRWTDKLKVWFKPPGWQPEDLARLDPRPPFDATRVPRFAPPLDRATTVFGAVQFGLALGAVALFLWRADAMPLRVSLVWLAALVVGLWSLGAVLQGRMSTWTALMLQAAALATVTADQQLLDWHRVFKPLAMVFAIASVARPAAADHLGPAGRAWLLAGLAASLAGDVALMFPGGFVPGLAAFLLAHLAYVALFRRDVGGRGLGIPLLATLAVGASIYAVLLPRLDPVLRIAVALYIVAIATMAAQAIARARALRDGPAVAVAFGAGVFMVSDAVLAIDRFVAPFGDARLVVLSTYYLAQVLIATQTREAAMPRADSVPVDGPRAARAA